MNCMPKAGASRLDYQQCPNGAQRNIKITLAHFSPVEGGGINKKGLKTGAVPGQESLSSMTTWIPDRVCNDMRRFHASLCPARAWGVTGLRDELAALLFSSKGPKKAKSDGNCQESFYASSSRALSSEPSIFSFSRRSNAPFESTSVLPLRISKATLYCPSIIARTSSSISRAVASL